MLRERLHCNSPKFQLGISNTFSRRTATTVGARLKAVAAEGGSRGECCYGYSYSGNSRWMKGVAELTLTGCYGESRTYNIREMTDEVMAIIAKISEKIRMDLVCYQFLFLSRLLDSLSSAS
jgi:hypothetical protein